MAEQNQFGFYRDIQLTNLGELRVSDTDINNLISDLHQSIVDNNLDNITILTDILVAISLLLPAISDINAKLTEILNRDCVVNNITNITNNNDYITNNKYITNITKRDKPPIKIIYDNRRNTKLPKCLDADIRNRLIYDYKFYKEYYGIK